jgi:tetratricopeptide (TPR) repeat protein
MAALFYRLKAYPLGAELLRQTSFSDRGAATAISCYYAAVFADLLQQRETAGKMLDRAAEMSPDYVFPDRLETIAILKHAERLRPNDWHISYYLGCLYLAHYRKDEAVAVWKKALSLGANYSVVHRNLGLVAWKMDNSTSAAIPFYEKAVALRPDVQALCRDLATLYQRSDQWTKTRDLLEKTLGFEQYRSDVIELLARTYHHLGEDEKAAKLIDSRTFQAWEGQRSLYEVYRDVHMTLGKKAFEAKDYKTAAAEFRRAMEYPANLGVGRPDGASQSDQKAWLEKALKAAGEKGAD